MAAQNSYQEVSGTSTNWEKDTFSSKKAPDGSDIESTAKGEPLDEAARLRMLGYDAVLGRPLSFWSSAAMNFCHMSFFFEFLAHTTSLAYNGPLVFLIGYPIAAIFQLILMGPFCEMVSAFPVAGAMATWSWQCARKGIRHERQWGYLVGGVVLMMHMAKIIFFMYNFSVSVEGILYETRPPAIYGDIVQLKVIIYIVFVTTVAILCLTRLSQNHIFWIIAAAVNICWFVVGLVAIGLSVNGYKKLAARNGWELTRTWGFGEPVRKNWTHAAAWMIFVALPLRVTAIDASAHMSEETQNPSKSVPRAMYASAIAHHVMTYIWTAAFICTTGTLDMNQATANYTVYKDELTQGSLGTIFMANAWLATDAVLKSGTIGPALQLAAFGWVGCTQATAAVTITSRFVFALARENGIPFSVLLVKTDKHRMPWVAMLIIICSLYLSTVGMSVNKSNYYNLIQSTAVSLLNVAYGIPLFLYITTKINFARDERSQFSLRGLGKPFAVISLGYLIVAMVQGCMPISIYNNAEIAPHLAVDTISAFVIVLPALLFIMLLSWLFYGRNHYIGPIRGLTKWTTGVEVDPLALDPSKHKHDALRRFVNMALGETSSEASTRVGSQGKSKDSASGTRSGSRSNSKSPMSPITGKLFSFRSGYTRTGSNPNSPLSQYTKGIATFGTHPESQILPGATTNGALAESALLPGQTMNPALVESNILPEQTIPAATAKLDLLLPPKEAKPSAWRGKLLTRTPMTKVKEDESMTLGNDSVTLGAGEAALAESQLDYQSRFNPAASSALEESQLDYQSRFNPAASSALEESQLFHATRHEPASLEESMIDPTQTSLSAFGDRR